MESKIGFVLALICCMCALVAASPLKKADTKDSDIRKTYEALVRKFAPLKKSLEIDSGLLFIDQSNTGPTFNELDVLELIPTIVRKLKQNAFDESKKAILKAIYGVLWQLIAEEAHRPASDPINPVLKELLYAQEIQLHRRQGRHYDNDIENNSVNRVVRQRVQPQFMFKKNPMLITMRLMKMKMREDLAPAQRLLKFAALLIHESMAHKQQLHKNKLAAKLRTTKRMRITKKQLAYNVADMDADDSVEAIMTVQPAVDVDEVEEPMLDMNLGSINVHSGRRMRRHIKYDADVVDDTDDKKTHSDEKDNNVEMNLLRSMIGKEDDGESAEEYVDESETETKKREATKSTGDYADYAFDVSDHDSEAEEEQLLRSYYAPRTMSAAFDDYDYGSVSELMQLGAKHNLRAQRDSNYFKHLRVDDYLNNDDDY